MKLYIVRHGKTDWNDKGIVQGTNDIELNNVGIMQAKELRNKIDIDKIDICYCSPLSRTKQTADIIVCNKVKIIYDDLLVERNFGDYEGKKVDFDSIVKQWDYLLNDSSNNLESIRDCLLRAEKFLNKLKDSYKDENILIVSHGGFIKMLHFNLVGYDLNTDFLSFFPDNATLYEYEL